KDARLCLDDLAERPERDALAVGQTAALTPRDQLRLVVDQLEELVDEPGLADPGNTDDRDELGRALIADAPEDRAQQLDLAVAADQRRVGTSGNVEAVPGDRLERFPDCDRVRLSLRRNSRSLAVADRIARGPTRRLPDKNAVDRRGRLQPCGSVDHVPRDHGLPF